MQIDCENVENSKTRKLEEKCDDEFETIIEKEKSDASEASDDKMWFTASGLKQYVRDSL